MARFTAGDERARLGGLALQAKLRSEKARAARLADLEAALRTVSVLVSAKGTPEERLSAVQAYLRIVLTRQAEV